MHVAEMLLLALILAFPLLDNGLARIGRGNTLHGYYCTVLALWLPTVWLLVLYANRQLSVPDLGLSLPQGWPLLACIAALLLLAGYILVAVRAVATDRETAQLVAAKLQDHRELLPATREQALVFCLMVSTSAGFCEELLFRGYLLPLLREHLGLAAAVLASSLCFGLWHAYLGWKAVTRTTLLGLLLAGVFLATDSLWAAIALHVLIDIYSGLLAYFALREAPAISRQSSTA
ncbi:MAG: CPBP family intramembrane glutamic endopeptidase [Lysobacter sp.]